MSPDPEPVPDALLRALEAGVRTYALAQPLHAAVPHSPNHPGFRLALTRRHGDMVRADGGSAASELIVTGGHVGTHVDALAHVSHEGRLHGGVDAYEAQRGGRFSACGIDTLGPVVTRGVLLDVAARVHDVGRLPAAHPITPAELEAAAAAAGVAIAPGDAVLVRTGWAQLWGDAAAFVGAETGVPGPTADAARWLVARGAGLVGSDTTAFEHIAEGAGHALLPAHRVLLVEAGVPIVEMLDLEGLAADGVTAFTFVLAPLPIVGGTGSPVNPLALVGA
ncbi:cyclase family protein [Baekduia soli]|uniref:Cyclase family protein n=1 Tax=Baekduia soli TaxID=496014 RepID=A0A5B8TZH2_9ACTN|nr:cyclase family protein [Baekduia soli]QEC46124.1 cyclase family protein [Baekduia soli]